MFTKRALLLLACWLLPTAGSAQPQPAQAEHFSRVTLEFRWPMVKMMPGILGDFSHLPAYVRTIPQHPEDTWFCCAGRPRVVPDANVSAKLYANFSAAVAPQINFRHVSLTVGANFSGFQLPTAVKDTSWTTTEINQGGSTGRGEGTSLVGTAIVARDQFYANPFVELSFHGKNNPNTGWLVGYAYTKVDVSVRAFYDRYDSLETYQRYSISNTTFQEFYTGMHAGKYFVWTVGIARQQPNLTALGRSMVTNFKPWGVVFMLAPTMHASLSRGK